MHVIQQPERARACGSGAKSSADRRPVDPPPIVELRVFEGEQDITFSYNANFFLFATLENARAMAQGRVAPTPATIPVLTGTPVAGMAYLDRPHPAGYFIFPDLSVRHEGKYRLSFALYEEIKEDKDRDPENPQGSDSHFPQNAAHVSHRLEVKSAPFTVFSAKKFPGLTESTALSRMVAEQGCRVRIRRDVRMRRRENKSNYSDEYDEDAGYDRSRVSATPDVYNQPSMSTPRASMDGGDRPRSVSNASNPGFSVPPQRRPSIQDMAAQSYQQAYPAHIAPQTPQNYSNQMSYPTNQPHTYQNGYAQQQNNMMPPQPSYQPAQHSYPAAPQQQMQQAYGYMPSQQYPQQQYAEQSHMRHGSMDYSNMQQYRSTPVPQQPTQYPSQNQNMSPYGSMESSYNRTHQINQSVPPMAAPPQMPSTSSGSSNGQALAPLKMSQPVVEKYEPVSPYAMNAPSSNMAESMSQEYHGTPITAPPKFTNQPQPSGPTKRSYSSTFDTQHIEQPLRQGARPDLNHDTYALASYDGTGDDDSDFMDPAAAMAAMSYRRADGTERRRRVPVNT